MTKIYTSVVAEPNLWCAFKYRACVTLRIKYCTLLLHSRIIKMVNTLIKGKDMK